TLVACPSLLGPYLRTFNTAMLEARPTYRLLQTYSLLSAVLRKVPVAGSSSSSEEDGGGGGAAAAGQALFSTVMPAELNKKELTRGVLSGSPLLQAATMNLMASILDRASLVVAAAAGSSPSPPGMVDMKRLLRQRMPDLQTLLGLRDKIGVGAGGASKVPGGQHVDRAVVLRWRVLSLLDRYARVIPSSVAAARFDFLKLLPRPARRPETQPTSGAPPAKAAECRREGGSSLEGGEGEGEAGVWLDVLALTPESVGVFLVLARSACENGHVLVAAGIRAAERGMRDNRFLRMRGGGGGGAEQREGDWEVEFSTLSVAAVTSLAGISADTLRTEAFGTSAGFRPSRGGGGTGPSSDLPTPPAVGPEPARLFTGAVSRVLHLHDDPRPFAGLCLAFAGDAAAATSCGSENELGADDDGGSGGGDGSDDAAASVSAAAKACQGLAISIARSFGCNAAAVGSGDRSAGNTAVHLLLKKRPPPRPTARAASAARLAATLADNLGLSVFELNRVRKLLLASSPSPSSLVPAAGSGGGGGTAVGGADAAELELLLSLPGLPLPRLIGDAFTILGRSDGGDGNSGSDDSDAAKASSTSKTHLLPCSNGRVFDALARRIAGGGQGEAVAAVRQVVSRLDLALDSAAVAASSAATMEEALLLSTGLRLVAGACLELVSSGTPSSSAARKALANVFRRPFLLRLACPLSAEGPAAGTGTDEVETAGEVEEKSLSEVACGDLSALVVAVAAAEEEEEEEEGGGVVAGAAAPFLERLCRATAAAVASGSRHLRWLSQAQIACRGSCSSAALSGVLAALLSRLSTTKALAPASGSPNLLDKDLRGGASDVLARRLLEQLLAPSPRRGLAGGGVACEQEVAWGGRGASLVARLRPESTEALMRLQVESPSPELGWLVCLAITARSSRDNSDVVGGVTADTATAAQADLLDAEVFFQHFFGRLTTAAGGTGGDADSRSSAFGSGGGCVDGDGADARILEELVRSCPSHANRFALAVLPVLRNLRPCDGEASERKQRRGDGGGTKDGGDLSMAQASLGAAAAAMVAAERSDSATASLLALRRPLTAFLTGGEKEASSRDWGLSGSTGTVRSKRKRFSAEAAGGSVGRDSIAEGRGDHGHRRVFVGRGGGGGRAVSKAAAESRRGKLNGHAAVFAELEEVLLPRCIVPLFEAAAGRVSTEGTEHPGGGTRPPKAVKRGLLSCLRAVLEISRGSESLAAAGALGALRTSMSACERLGKRPPPDAQAHALARAALAAWLSPPGNQGLDKAAGDDDDEPGPISGPRSAASPPAMLQTRAPTQHRQQQQEEARRDYLRHCLARSAMAARAVGRAARKASAAAAAAGGAGGGTGDTPGENKTAAAKLAGDEDKLCKFLLGEVVRVVSEAAAEDGAATTAAAASASLRAELLLGLGRDPAAAGGDVDAAVVAVEAFLTAVLKHRLADPGSLRAVRTVACTLYQRRRQQPQRRKRQPEPLLSGTEAMEQGDHSSKKGQDEAEAALESAAAVSPLLPGWSTATMLERVVGHSGFLSVLEAEGTPRRELLKLLVLLVSAGGVMPPPGTETAAGIGVGVGLVRPLLSVYRVSMSEDDQIYDPCFVLPLLEWGLRSAIVKAQAVCESLLLGYVIMATSSLSLSTRASAYSCLFHLLEALQEQEAKTASLWTAASSGGGGGAAGFKARKAAEAAFRQRPQLTLLLRCLRDGVETPLQRVPCAVAVVLAKASEALASSPGSEVYRVVNSFLLHRPFVRLDELPLFDVLFTGVQQGEGGRDGGRGGHGDTLGATSASDPGAASNKARVWMLRALRDGLRTSEDLELAAGKRAVPLLLAMADSPVGNGDAAIQELIVDILGRVSSLERSGAR
ncbi:unnamed protein product, partial [Ectocarpus sp. 4 AP-2014]